MNERKYPSDARLWACLADEFHAAGADRDARQIHARRAVALVRRERGTDRITGRGGPRTFAPGEEIPLDVMRAYDLDGDIWERQSADPESTLKDTWKMPGFDPEQHESACEGAWITPYLLDRYGPLTEADPVSETQPGPVTALSEDRRVLVIRRRTEAGVQTVTLHRQDGAGPFTDEDVTYALSAAQRSAAHMQQGQRNITRRAVTRHGTLWAHVMLGPPTWWVPRLRREKDGTLVAGWFRAAVAARFDRKATSRELLGEGE